MSIPLPDGTTIRRAINCGANTGDLAESLANAMEDAGWTKTATPSAAILFINNPYQFENNNTVTINGVVYTFKTAINNANPREILVDTASTANCVNRLVACINDSGTGKGTDYSTATAANTDVLARTFTDNNGKTSLFLTSLALTGKDALALTIAETCAAFGIYGNYSTFWYSGYKMRSPVNSQGLRAAVTIAINPSDVFLLATDPDDATDSPLIEPNANWLINDVLVSALNYATPFPRLVWVSGRDFEVVCSKYTLAYAILGTSTIDAQSALISIPQLKPFLAPLLITAMSGGSGSNVVITVAEPEYTVVNTSSLWIGDTGTGLDNASWEIESITDNGTTLSIELTDSTAVSVTTYNSRGVAADESKKQIGRALFMCRDTGYSDASPRRTISMQNGSSYTYTRFNSHQHRGVGGANVGRINVLYLDRAYQWFGDRWWFSPATIVSTLDLASYDYYIFGEMYGVAVSARGAAMDTIQADTSGQYWWQITGGTQTDPKLWIACPAGYN